MCPSVAPHAPCTWTVRVSHRHTVHCAAFSPNCPRVTLQELVCVLTRELFCMNMRKLKARYFRETPRPHSQTEVYSWVYCARDCGAHTTFTRTQPPLAMSTIASVCVFKASCRPGRRRGRQCRPRRHHRLPLATRPRRPRLAALSPSAPPPSLKMETFAGSNNISDLLLSFIFHRILRYR